MDPVATTVVVAVGLLVVYYFFRSGLFSVVLTFVVVGALTFVLESLVFIGLRIALPNLESTGVFQMAYEYWYALPVLVGGIAAFNMWREMH